MACEVDVRRAVRTSGNPVSTDAYICQVRGRISDKLSHRCGQFGNELDVVKYPITSITPDRVTLISVSEGEDAI